MKVTLAACVFVATSLVLLEAKPFHGQLLKTQSKGRAVKEVWQDCSQPGDVAKINSVKIVPDPPVKGQSVSINATVTLANFVSDGQIDVDVMIDGIPILQENYDLCDEVVFINLKCPIKEGSYVLTSKYTITDLAPPGNYSIKAVITEQNNKEVVCVKANFKL